MTLTTGQALASIAVMAVVTFLTRALPFLLFDRGDHPPKVVLYLGKVLPPAIIAMLIIYCLRGISFAAPAGWVPSALAGVAAPPYSLEALVRSLVIRLLAPFSGAAGAV